MNLSGNTILITGGTSGIGYEFAVQLLKRRNVVIITGRDQARLEQVQRSLGNVHTFQSDVSDPTAILSLFSAVVGKFPGLNMLINNAGIMRRINLLESGGGIGEIGAEVETDLLGTVRMVKQFLPHLMAQDVAAIVNVSSGLAFVPLPIAPIYCAAKAGVHSFSQSLRVQLRDTRVSVFELAPPMTRTSLFTKDIGANDVRGIGMMDVSKMVGHAIRGIERDCWEIRPGLSNVLKLMSRIAPRFALNRLSRTSHRAEKN